MTRKEFVKMLKAEVAAFDAHFAKKYPTVGESDADDGSAEMGFGDWFEQFLAFSDDKDC